MSDFQKALAYTLQNEGGEANNVHDSGGYTNFGITIGTLSQFRQEVASLDDVKNLTREQAEEIYRSLFWDKMQLDQIKSDRIAMALFDVGVNRGPLRAVQDAQRVVGNLPKIDGVMGPLTIAAINERSDVSFLCTFTSMQVKNYADIVIHDGSQMVFLRGWLNRVLKLLDLLEVVKC